MNCSYSQNFRTLTTIPSSVRRPTTTNHDDEYEGRDGSNAGDGELEAGANLASKDKGNRQNQARKKVSTVSDALDERTGRESDTDSGVFGASRGPRPSADGPVGTKVTRA